MVITLVDEILALWGGRMEQMWTGFSLGFTLFEASKTKGNNFFGNPFHSFVIYKRFLGKEI